MEHQSAIKIDTCNNWMNYAEWKSQSQKLSYYMVPFTEYLYNDNILEMENRLLVGWWLLWIPECVIKLCCLDTHTQTHTHKTGKSELDGWVVSEVISSLWFCAIVLEGVIIWGTWVKGPWDFSVVFFSFFHILLLLFKYSCPHFSPAFPTTPAIPTSHPQSYLPLALSMCPLYMFPTTLPPFPSFIPPPPL